MDYEIAKQLIERGFPQGEGDYFVGKELWDRTQQSDYESRSTPRREDWIYCPTFSELIEACGDSFDSLKRATEDFMRPPTL